MATQILHIAALERLTPEGRMALAIDLRDAVLGLPVAATPTERSARALLLWLVRELDRLEAASRASIGIRQEKIDDANGGGGLLLSGLDR